MEREQSPGQVITEPPLVRVERAAELLSLSRARVYELISENQLRSAKLGKSRRVFTESVYAYIAASEVRA